MTGSFNAIAWEVRGGVGTLSTAASQIRIVADESTNSLLIRATQADYQLLQGLVQQIDLRPLQVLIEVTIAEVQRSKDLDLGLGGTATRKGATPTAKRDTVALLPGNVSARDFIFQLTGGNGSISYLGALSALQTRGDVKVLSLPVIIAQNNKEAKLNVGEQRPFVQVNQSVTTGTVPTTVQTVQYINVGTTLTITPTINAIRESTALCGNTRSYTIMVKIEVPSAKTLVSSAAITLPDASANPAPITDDPT